MFTNFTTWTRTTRSSRGAGFFIVPDNNQPHYKVTIDRIVRGGYPDALRYSSEPKRTAWYRDYIEALIRHDVPDIAGIRSLDTLSKLLSLAATQTAQLFNTSNLSKSFQLSRLTIHDYLTILETTFMITRLLHIGKNKY